MDRVWDRVTKLVFKSGGLLGIILIGYWFQLLPPPSAGGESAKEKIENASRNKSMISTTINSCHFVISVNVPKLKNQYTIEHLNKNYFQDVRNKAPRQKRR